MYFITSLKEVTTPPGFKYKSFAYGLEECRFISSQKTIEDAIIVVYEKEL